MVFVFSFPSFSLEPYPLKILQYTIVFMVTAVRILGAITELIHVGRVVLWIVISIVVLPLLVIP